MQKRATKNTSKLFTSANPTLRLRHKGFAKNERTKMPKIYARETKLKNVVGRSDYINNQERQEEIVFQKSFMENDWNDYVKYEKEHQKTNHENIQARETVIALPNELSEHIEVLEKVCDDLGHNLYGFNRDFEYAVHWNESHTNLHAHFIYSERERNQERIAKVYKRDMWYDIETNKMAKANAENAKKSHKEHLKIIHQRKPYLKATP